MFNNGYKQCILTKYSLETWALFLVIVIKNLVTQLVFSR